MAFVRDRQAGVRDRLATDRPGDSGRTLSAWPDANSGARMTVVEGILLAVSVAVFIYLGVAMFKPEWF
jgi:K+-transporting ATPase KdpF subunit